MSRSKRIAIAAGGVLVVGLGTVALQQIGYADRAESQPLPPTRTVPSDIGPDADAPFPRVEGVPDSFGEGMARQREAGWTAFVIAGDRVGFRPWEFNRPDNPASPGDWTEVVDTDGTAIGFYVHPVGFVEKDEFDPATFDWKAAAIERGASGDWVTEQESGAAGHGMLDGDRSAN